MPASVLPPIEWEASCGHWNSVRSDTGGFKVNCKTCGANLWCPKRKAAGRSQIPRARVTGRSAAAAAVARPRARQLGQQTLRARPPAKPSGGVQPRVVEPSVVIPPSRPPAVKPSRPPVTIPATPLRPRRARPQPEPAYGLAVQPLMGPWCQVCSFMGWRAAGGRFALATVALDMTTDGRLLVCGNCAARIRSRFPGEILRDRKLPGQPGTPRNGEVYRSVGPPRRLVRCGWCGGLKGTSPCHECVRRELDEPGSFSRGTAEAG